MAVPEGFAAANEMVQWTISSDKRREPGERPGIPAIGNR